MTGPGVLLMTFGAVERPEDLPAYYTNIRGGQPPSPDQLADLERRYVRIGGSSPLAQILSRQAGALERHLRDVGLEVPVEGGMRYWTPTIADGLRRLVARGADRVIAITSGPYDSRISVGAYERRLRDAALAVPGVRVDLVRAWFEEPALDRAWTARCSETLAALGWGAGTFHTLFSAHALPERALAWGDPYPHQFALHARRMARVLRAEPWGQCYQSAGLTRERWMGPDILDAIDSLAASGARRILSVPTGFCADHLEILHDLDIEARERAEGTGVEWARAGSLNDSKEFIAMLSEIVRRRIEPSATRGVPAV